MRRQPAAAAAGAHELYQLHRVDPKVPLEDSLAALIELREEGKIARIGLSNVSVDQLSRAREVTPIVSVRNRYSLIDRAADDVLGECEGERIAFLPWFPLSTGKLAERAGPLAQIAERHQATPAQIALAWLLGRSPVMLPVPGTASIEHLEENVGAAGIELSADEMQELGELGAGR